MTGKHWIAVLLLWSVWIGNSQAAPQPETSAHWVDSTLNSMTLEEKIGQLFMIAAYSNRNEVYENNIEALIRKYRIGGLIFFQGEPTRQVNLTNRYQKASKYPLMIGMDAEHGIGWRLTSGMEFPKMLIDGAIGNDSLIFRLGASIARQCRELGVHVNFAPVVDINSNPQNPIIGMRSFGEKREEVTRKAIQYMNGTLSCGVLPVAKHFPGHGDTDVDSHKALPSIAHSIIRLDSIELYPYKQMIEARLPAIMIAHLNVPALDSTGTPASLSPLIVNGFLKEKLHFNGLCFTDAMNMKGATGSLKPGEAEVKALLAGNDILLFPENLEKAIIAIQEAIRDSLLPESLIEEKCRKILTAKQKYVLPNIQPISTEGLWSRLNAPQDFAVKQELYKEAITLIKNNDSLLPLKRLDTLRIASVNFGGKALNNFQTQLSRYAAVNHFVCPPVLTNDDINQWKTKLKKYNCIIIYNNRAANNPTKNFGYSNDLARLISSMPEKRIILCHPGTPYGLKNYVPIPMDAILLNYENNLYAEQYAAQAIFGGISIQGKLPVSINSRYPSGYSLKTTKNRLGYQSPEMCGISSASLAKIDSLCEAAIRIKATPGCQVLVARDGYVFYNKAFGYNTYRKETPNHTSNIYDLASVTKITATLPAVMKLYDEKKIDLDSSLSTYYTALKKTNKEELTVREVLCHNAGLKTYIPFFVEAIDKKSLSGTLFSTVKNTRNTLKLKDRLYVNPNYRFKDSTLSNTPKEGYLKMEPGLYMFPSYRDTVVNTILNSELLPAKNYAYSDLGFMLLKYAVEETTQKQLDEYCKDSFYKKLGMNNTDFRAAERLNAKYIVPSNIDKLYRKTELKGCVHDPAAALLGGIAGHAGLFSTADDLAKISEMLLNKGTYGGETFFSPETVDTFTRKNETFTNNRRALGFDKPETDTTKLGPTCRLVPACSYGHTGFTGIYSWSDPDNRLIYIFLSNRTYPDEFNTKLSEESIRTKIQEVIYRSIP